MTDLLAKRDRLLRLRDRLDQELAAIENGLRVAGQLPPGQPIRYPLFTTAEARDAHRRFQQGERTPEVIEGNRRYQRDNARARRQRKAAS